MIKTYSKALEYFAKMAKPEYIAKIPFTSQEGIRDFLKLAGDPQDKFESIQIGGTAGKTSTAYMSAHLLSKFLPKVGLHVSPYLLDLKEKFQIIENTKIRMCNENEFVDLTNWFLQINSKFEETHCVPISYFEAMIILTFKFFKMNKVSVAVVEVGLGGKLDATNVLNSKIQVLTNVGLDHTEILGNTVEEILEDKKQIMKKNCIFISGLKEKNLNECIIEYGQELNSDIQIVGKEFDFEVNNDQTMNFKNEDLEIRNIKLKAKGDFQYHNAALAIQACYNYLTTKSGNFELMVKETFQNLAIKGRFEIIQRSPLIIQDGAHSPMKMEKLVDSILKHYSKFQTDVLFSCKEGKDLENILKEISRLKINKLYLCEINFEYYSNIKSFKLEYIKDCALQIMQKGVEIIQIKDPMEAYSTFKSNLNEKNLGVITGSLYLLSIINIYTNKNDKLHR